MISAPHCLGLWLCTLQCPVPHILTPDTELSRVTCFGQWDVRHTTNGGGSERTPGLGLRSLASLLPVKRARAGLQSRAAPAEASLGQPGAGRHPDT